MYITNREPCFPRETINDAIEYMRRKWPEEACGIFVDYEFCPFENKAENKLDSFLINDPLFDKLYAEGRVQCVLHSHETGSHSAMASTEDQQQQLELDIPCGIISFRNRSVTHVVFWGDQLPIEPLIQRHFFYGVWDCYGLCRDYIRMNFGYNPPNTPREFVFWFKAKPFMETTLEELPFIDVPLEDVKENDFILYNIRGTKYINHCGIYLGNRILHHFYGQVSMYLPRTEYYNYARKAVRHNPDWIGYKE